MTAKEEAENIFKTYLRYTPVEFEYEYAKKCALIDIQNRINLARQFVIMCDLETNSEASNIYKNLKSIKLELEKL